MARTPDPIIDRLAPEVLFLHFDRHISGRAIAKLTGMARGTVARILHHTRPGPAQRAAALSETPTEFDGLMTCPQCHVLMACPCPACAARAYRKAHRFPE
jgi:hypothetical protein